MMSPEQYVEQFEHMTGENRVGSLHRVLMLDIN